MKTISEKTVVNREKSTNTVIAARRRFAPPIAKVLDKLLRPELAEGESLPDLELLQDLFGRALERRRRGLVTAYEVWFQARQRRRRLVARSGAAVRKLYRRVIDLRSLMEGIFGAGTGHLFGLTGETSRDPLVLLRQADRAITHLGDPARALPKASFTPTPHDRARWLTPVEAAAQTLRPILAQANLARKEVEGTQAEMRRRLADFNAVFVHTASFFEGIYRAAGRDRWAEIIRPSRRRHGLLLRNASRAGEERAASEESTAGTIVATEPQTVGDTPESDVPGRDSGAQSPLNGLRYHVG